jgi:alanine racemase
MKDVGTEHRAGAVLTIDLDAIVHNWRTLGRTLAPGCRAAAVVKADGYGLGALPIAKALSRAGCTRFFVATLEEGAALRCALPDAEIVVLNGVMQGEVADFHHFHLAPLLASLAQADAWRDFAVDQRQRLPAALQIDTGMSRLGLTLTEAARLAEQPDFKEAVELTLIASHLACADDPSHDLNRRQLERFATARQLFPGIEGSLAASSGIFLGPDWHADWVRPGAALFGVNPTPGLANPMRPVVRLQAKILQTRDIDDAASVGYGATLLAEGPTRLAIVAAGYADGVFRSLSNRGHGHIGDKRVPVVGRVSMDLTTFDVTGLSSVETVPGAMVDLIGPRTSLDEVAADAGTIAYEILTGLGPRLLRRYVSDQAS